MRYILFTLGMLVFGTSAMMEAAYAAPYVENEVVLTESSPASEKVQKGSFTQRVFHFFNALKEKAKKAIAPFSLIVLAILTPPLAVGIATNWDPDKVLIAILLTLLCTLPGIIYAIVVVSKS
jgi:uncharacterized membrane protein YqaE (UPF0057 family)